MKQHPGSNSGAEATKTAAAAGSMLHSIYPMQHVSVLSIPPTRWIATSLGSGAFSQKLRFNRQLRRSSVTFCFPHVFLLCPIPRQGHIVMQAAALLLSTLGGVCFKFQVSFSPLKYLCYISEVNNIKT